ncbi:MAG: GDP-mannose 4,6-dehydratase [Chloroflexi bacterium]|nr:GDP-mannose 4,6-dehydratase [Chloroflexota bacterium]
MRAMVTGGAGFIGSHLVELLIAEGHDVSIVDDLSTGKRTNILPEAHFYFADIRSEEIKDVISTERPDVIFHQAAQSSVKVSTDDPRRDADINILGLIRLLDAASASGVRKVVFASSGATYGNPQYLPMDEDHPQLPESPYGITKLMSEHYLKYYALDRGVAFTALRYGNVYGPRQDPHGEAGVVAIFTQQLLDGKTPTVHWDGKQTRDYVSVKDVARANLAAAFRGDGRAFCIGTGKGTSVNTIFSLLCKATGRDVEPMHSPRRPGDLRHAHFDCTRARKELGWTATMPLQQGLTDTVQAFREQIAAERKVLTVG